MTDATTPAPGDHEHGDIQVEMEIRVLSAPDTSLISLELIQQSDPRLLHVNGGVITIGTGDPAVEYQVDGWDDYACALRVSRLGLEDLAEDDGDPFHEPAVVAGGCDTAGTPQP